MSSDESTSTQISAISSQLEIDKKLQPQKPEQWEINLIGNFLLKLYHRLLISPQNEWTINKTDMRKEFQKFVTADLKKKLQELNGTTNNIGSLLHRCGFLINTERGSNLYKIRYKALFDFRNKKLKEQDNWRLNKDVNNEETDPNENALTSLVDKTANIVMEEKIEVDKDEPKNPLEYLGSTKKQRQPNYCPTNMSCTICQEDFATMEKYEDHIQKHNDETDFEYLNTMSKDTPSIFTISYRLCKNSHYFCFDIETKSKKLIIEKIIIVQSRSFFYVHNMRVPYSMPDSGHEQFFVDSHLFTKFVEQPIVLICHLKDSPNTRIIEEHHFMRCEEFPKVGFAIRPYLLPDKLKFKPVFELADYFPPKEIQVALNDEFYNEKLMKVSNEFRDYVRNEKKLQPQTIGPSINILLQIEDLDTLKQYFNLTQRDVKLRSFGDEYSFRLRPKQRIFIENILTVFDEVILTSRPNISTKPEDLIQLMLQNKDDINRMTDTYVGQVEDVNSSRISFKCYQKINLNRTYTVICRPSRLNIRYQYRSLEMLPTNMYFLKNFLFPAQIVPRPLSTISLTLYNKNISGNPEQLQTVRNIAEGPRNDATYIIFGPPGTGKTTTVVEAILQVLKRPDTKVLVTASSNSACDEVAIRLCKQLDQLDMGRSIVRIYSRSSENRIDTIDDELLAHSNMYNGQFFPAIEILHEYRIVVCTLSIVAKLATGKFGRGEFGGTQYTHVFIDEVAATMEAEALIGITSILTPKSSLIIAGDHKQLGPILQSKRAEELGLGVSLMDRLMARECYRVDSDTGEYDRTIQTRLRLNFRSHPDIVNLYSGMYYNHGLEAKAKLADVSLVNRWHLARDNKEYPIIFHCIDAPSCSDNQSKSLYNLQELNVVMDYVKDLMYFGIDNKPVKETDIGIISPYKKQYRCIQEQLNLRKWFKIETGSVETFQGKEKNIIIVSFVRSGTSTLGFLENPRRLNVTISRAKSLLIMIGNPKTLSLNSDYEYIIKECRRHNTLIGFRENFRHSVENLNHNRNRNNSENKPRNNRGANNDQQQRHQRNLNTRSKPLACAADIAQMPALNTLMQQLNVTMKPPEDNAANAKRRRSVAKRGRRAGKSKNKQQTTSKQTSQNNSDEDDDDKDSDIESISGGSSAGAGRTQNHAGSKTTKSHQPTTTRGQVGGGNSGKISKQYNKGKPLTSKVDNKQQQKCKIESLFDDLPKVPKSTANVGQDTQKYPNILIPKYPNVDNFLQQQQHQYQQQQNINMNNMTNMPMHHPNTSYPHAIHNPDPRQPALPLWFDPRNLMQEQQQRYHMQTQHQQQQHAFVNNPSLTNHIYSCPPNNMGMPTNNNNNKQSLYPTIVKTNSSSSNTGIMTTKNVAKISPSSTSALNKITSTTATTSKKENPNDGGGSLKHTSLMFKDKTAAEIRADQIKAAISNKSRNSPLSVKPILTTTHLNSSVAQNNRPITATATSSSSGATKPNPTTTSSFTRLPSYETAAKQMSSNEANAILSSSSGAIRKFPQITPRHSSSTTTATASVRPVIRQSSKEDTTPTNANRTSSISSASASGTTSSSANNWRSQNNNFVDSYNAQTTRLNTTTTTSPKTDFGTLTTSSASANTNSYRNYSLMDSNNAPTPYVPPYVHTAIRQLKYDESKPKKEENKCIIS